MSGADQLLIGKLGGVEDVGAHDEPGSPSSLLCQPLSAERESGLTLPALGRSCLLRWLPFPFIVIMWQTGGLHLKPRRQILQALGQGDLGISPIS
jgi:hypothetical protein